ncbi:hypothetical protein DL96DRAFT_1623186 [Flagelloscypha sp. PMI_526]|nr:hypothetical protein DL96DRAFT_1623186 [Flagelloscypha sp. PMI_526]
MASGLHKFTKEAAAALIFFIGYACIFAWLLFAYLTRRIKWKSRYTLLLFHVTIRIASQACGIAFGIFGFDNLGVFLAYLILGAEGYFTLVLCAYRFLISWHQHNLPSKESWLEPRNTKERNKTLEVLIILLLWPLAIYRYRKNFMVWVHSVLVIANTAIISGASYLAAGQSIFLACNFVLLFSIVQTIRKDKRELMTKGEGKIHPTLILLLVTWFPLIVRGIFGVLQSVVWEHLTLFRLAENYESTGMSEKFTAIEYCLGVLPEWLAAALLLCSYGTSKDDPTKGDGPVLMSTKEGDRFESA